MPKVNRMLCPVDLSELDPWSIVLAGGQGRRLADVTSGVPKQFWAPAGGPTLLRGTLDRLDGVVPPARRVLVTCQAHRSFLRDAAAPARRVLWQPEDRGTAPAVILGLLPLADVSPDAVVILSPADHGVLNVSLFREGLTRAVGAVQRGRAGIVLCGVEPDTAETSYGWISRGARQSAAGLERAAAFVEKPDQAEADQLLASGAVWNTMVLVARVSALFELIRDRQPRLTSVLATAWHLAPQGRGEALIRAYDRIPPSDFSRDVLAGALDLALFVWPRETGWSDLGTPGRLEAWGRARRARPRPRRALGTRAADRCGSAAV